MESEEYWVLCYERLERQIGRAKRLHYLKGLEKAIEKEEDLPEAYKESLYKVIHRRLDYLRHDAVARWRRR